MAIPSCPLIPVLTCPVCASATCVVARGGSCSGSTVRVEIDSDNIWPLDRHGVRELTFDSVNLSLKGIDTGCERSYLLSHIVQDILGLMLVVELCRKGRALLSLCVELVLEDTGLRRIELGKNRAGIGIVRILQISDTSCDGAYVLATLELLCY